MDRTPKAGEFYRHFKNKLYQIVGIAQHSETGEELVVYQALYGDFRLYARPLSLFVSEVDHEKYPEAAQKYRFERVAFKRKGEGADAGVREGSRIHPLLEEFFDARGYEKQLEILGKMRGKIGQRELDHIYLALDISPMAGDEDSQLSQIMRHLETRKRYDGSRLRP